MPKSKNPEYAALNAAIGKRVAERRRIKGLTQARLAELMGVSVNSVKAWEQGRANPYLRFPLLTSVLGCSPDWLYSGKTSSLLYS